VIDKQRLVSLARQAKYTATIKGKMFINQGIEFRYYTPADGASPTLLS